MKNLTIARHISEAEKAWSNLTGDAAGGRKEEYLSMNGSLSNMNGMVQQSGIKSITFDITNTDPDHDLAAVLFGSLEGYAQPFNGSKDFFGTTSGTGVGIVVTPKSYSLNELNKLSETNPMTFIGYRYDFGDFTQLKQDWALRRKEGTEIRSDIHSPAEMQNLGNNIQTIMDNPDFFMRVDPKQTLFIRVAKAFSATSARRIQLIFKVGTEVDITRALKGQPVVVQNGTF